MAEFSRSLALLPNQTPPLQTMLKIGNLGMRGKEPERCAANYVGGVLYGDTAAVGEVPSGQELRSRWVEG